MSLFLANVTLKSGFNKAVKKSQASHRIDVAFSKIYQAITCLYVTMVSLLKSMKSRTTDGAMLVQLL